MKKNVSAQVIGAQMCSATDGSNFTGTVTVYVTGDGGTQAIGSVGSGVCTHEGNGFHAYFPAQAETNYDHVAFTFVGTGAISSTVQVYTTFPQTGDNFARIGAPAGASISADIAAAKVDTAAIKVKTDFLPSATAGAAGGVFIAGSNAATSITTALTANFVGNITGNLSGSVGSVTGAVGSVTGAVGSVTGLTASNLDVAVSSRMASYTQPTGFLAATFPTTVASTTNITAGTITTVTNLTNAATAGDLTATMKASVASAAWDATATSYNTAGTMGNKLNSAASAGDPWTTALPGSYTAGSAGYIVGTNLNAAITSRMATYTQPTGFLAATFPGTVASPTNITAATGVVLSGVTHTGAVIPTVSTLTGHTPQTGDTFALIGATGSGLTSLASASNLATLSGYVDTEVAAIKAKTDNLPAAPAAVSDIPTAIQNADTLLNRDMSAGTDSGSPTVRTVRQALRFLRNKWSISGTTLTVTKEDDATASWTSTVATTPGADPVTGNDPA